MWYSSKFQLLKCYIVETDSKNNGLFNFYGGLEGYTNSLATTTSSGISHSEAENLLQQHLGYSSNAAAAPSGGHTINNLTNSSAINVSSIAPLMLAPEQPPIAQFDMTSPLGITTNINAGWQVAQNVFSTAQAFGNHRPPNMPQEASGIVLAAGIRVPWPLSLTQHYN